MDSFRITQNDHPQGFPIVKVEGYLAKEGGASFRQCVKQLLALGRTHILVDFSACSIISSAGVSALLDAVCEIHEDFGGGCILVALDTSKIKFLTMTGIVPLARTAETLDQGAAMLAGTL